MFRDHRKEYFRRKIPGQGIRARGIPFVVRSVIFCSFGLFYLMKYFMRRSAWMVLLYLRHTGGAGGNGESRFL